MYRAKLNVAAEHDWGAHEPAPAEIPPCPPMLRSCGFPSRSGSSGDGAISPGGINDQLTDPGELQDGLATEDGQTYHLETRAHSLILMTIDAQGPSDEIGPQQLNRSSTEKMVHDIQS